MNVFDVVPKKNRALLMANYNRALNGESFSFTQEVIGQDLKNHHRQNWFSPINNKHNNIISIELETFRQGLKVRYCDNGQGFPEEIDFNNPINLGLNLIHAQLKQLDADYTVDTDCKFNLEFEFMTTDRGSHSNF